MNTETTTARLPAQLGAFAYGQSRSGKTTYWTPVLMRPDLDTEDEDTHMVQGFLFLPTEDMPWGELNRPYAVHVARLADDLGLVKWDVWPDGTRERIEALARELADPAHHSRSNECSMCGAEWVNHVMDHGERCVYIAATDEPQQEGPA